MSEKLIRVYRKLSAHGVKTHTLIYGDLSASCSHCKALDIKLDARICNNCHTEFHYLTFRNAKNHHPKILKLYDQEPNLTIIDFEDFKRVVDSSKVDEFFK